MPKLPEDVAKAASEAEDGFKPMEEGLYEVELLEVQTEKNGKPLAGKDSGVPYWNWVFQIPEDADRYKKRRFWVVTSLGESSAFKMKECFKAFGGDPLTGDTDDYVGQRCMARVGTYVQQTGRDADQVKNQIEQLMPKDGADSAPAKGKGKAAKPDMF